MSASNPSYISNGSALVVTDLRHSYVRRAPWSFGKQISVDVLKGISVAIPAGKTLGLVGESGCGKTTLVKSILRLIEPTSGQIHMTIRGDDNTAKSVDVLGASSAEMSSIRKKLQIVFQDPYGSLNPRMSVRQTLSEPLITHMGYNKSTLQTRIDELMQLVGLNPIMADRYPHEFSGGQRQRIGIARALAFEPEVLILDEPVSALDVSVQAQILNLISGLQTKLKLTYLFVSHDLAVIRHVADFVAVMYLGKIVESGPTDAMFDNPAHPYTQALLSASPIPDVALERKRKRIILQGDVSNIGSTMQGCQFAPRCHIGRDKEICATVSPILNEVHDRQSASCHFPRLRTTSAN